MKDLSFFQKTGLVLLFFVWGCSGTMPLLEVKATEANLSKIPAEELYKGISEGMISGEYFGYEPTVTCRLNFKMKKSFREEAVRRHPRWTEEIRKQVLRGKIWRGMGKEELLGSRGLPRSITPSPGTDGHAEYWLYRSALQSISFYLEEGIVRDWRD